jgi:hypothetical protein
MSQPALDRFRTEFRRWVRAHNATHAYDSSADELLGRLEKRIPSDALAHIGSAYMNGWLVTESDPGRGYFVREADRPGRRGGQTSLVHRGNGAVDPWWELFVQLGDYAWLRTIAGRYGQYLKLEDQLMDLTVRSGTRLLLYVEHKETEKLAKSLLREMVEYGKSGFGLADPDKGNDPLRKAKYLVKENSHPLYFGLSAVGYKQLFRVEYLDGTENRFNLTPDNRPFAGVLSELPSPGAVAPAWSPLDELAIEIQHACPECWVSVGSGQTAYNFYAPGESDAIILGIYGDGTLWSDMKKLGPERSSKLSAALANIGIELPTTNTWAFWKRQNKTANAADLDPAAVARAIREGLD